MPSGLKSAEPARALTLAARAVNTGVPFRFSGFTMEVLGMRRRASSHGKSWPLVAAAVLAAGVHCTGDKPQPPLFAPPEPVAFSVHVSYCNATPGVLAVPGTLVQIHSESTVLEATTGDNGVADFGAITPDTYDVAVSRATAPTDGWCVGGGDVNTLIQFLNGLRVPGDCSLRAGDVLQDGGVTSDDLDALRHFTIFDVAHGGHTMEWRFLDVTPRIDVGAATVLEIRAVVLGDADMSWPGRR